MRIILVAGRSGSGKTTFAELLKQFCLNHGSADILTFDDYYRKKEELPENPNFDDPSSVDFQLFMTHIDALRNATAIEKPTYCFVTHNRKIETQRLESVETLIIEGIFAMQIPRLLEIATASIFVETPPELCLMRRIERDIYQRGRTRESVISQWYTQVEPAALTYLCSQKENATFLIDGTEKFEIQLKKITSLSSWFSKN